MKVKMLTLDAGPDGVRQPGKVYDVPANEAKALIAGGYAVDAANLKPDLRRRDAPEKAVARRGQVATAAPDDEDAPEE